MNLINRRVAGWGSGFGVVISVLSSIVQPESGGEVTQIEYMFYL